MGDDFELCPFCGHHPYEYEDTGVGMMPVAANCCDVGWLMYARGWTEEEVRMYADEAIIGNAEPCPDCEPQPRGARAQCNTCGGLGWLGLKEAYDDNETIHDNTED